MKERRFIGFEAERLLSPQSALQTFFSVFVPAAPSREWVALADATGRVLAQDVVAEDDLPNAPRSAMDGFALVAASTPGVLRIVSQLRVNEVLPVAIGSGSAVRIATGGTLPGGADSVVPIEQCRVEGESVRIDQRVASNECVVAPASDMRRGELLLQRGRRIGAAESGVLATLGITVVPVVVRPRVALISTGDELVDADRTPAPGQVRDSNRWALAAALHEVGALPVHFATVGDDEAALRAVLLDAVETCELVMVTGGSSVGERDRTPEVIEQLGHARVLVHGLRIKPGKPTLIAIAHGKPVIGLPGNPTSALVVFEAIVSPIIASIVGSRANRLAHRLELTQTVRKRPGWTWYVPVRLVEDQYVEPLGIHSSMVSLPARADGYAVLGEEIAIAEGGTLVDVRVFERA